jgi:peroxiredoxin
MSNQQDQRPRRRWRLWVLEGLLLIGLYWAVSAWQTKTLPARGPAPNFSLTDLQGHNVTLDELRGKAVLLHFWATWCGVCRAEISALNAVYDQLDSDEALVTIVADSGDRAKVARFVAEHQIRYPVLLGTDPVLVRYGVSAFPTNVFVAPDGTLDSATVGLSTRWSLLARLGCAR